MPEGAYRWFVFAELALAAVTFVALLFVVAPYGGRHGRSGWGTTVPSRVGWIVMEAPASVAFLLFYLLGAHRAEVVPLLFLLLWQAHYVQRAFVYPFLMRSGSRMPVLVMLLAILFNLLNAWVNARWISEYGDYPLSWLTDLRFWLGVALFAVGYALNIWSDRILRGLRRGGPGYRIPYGGGFRFVSSPNYLGEIVEWTGWAIATWSVAGLAFALYTIANLAPRAMANHRWYQATFPEYPVYRRALIPFLL